MASDEYLARMKSIMLLYGFGGKMIQRMMRAEGYTVPASNKTVAIQMNKLIAAMTDDELEIWQQVSAVNANRHFNRNNP